MPERGGLQPRAGGRQAASSRRANARAAFRVATRLPIRHRRLDPDEAARRERELRSLAPAGDLEMRDPAAAAWLARIESKLDRVLAHLGESPDDPLGEGDLRDVDLSSTGVRLASPEPLGPGDAVWVECLVPGAPERRVRALARAVRVQQDAAGARCAALEFRVITDRDRDALVRFTQDVQRCAGV